MYTVESFREFCQRMNCDRLVVNNRYLFRNGGQSNGETRDNFHQDPPTDERSRLTLQLEFLQAELHRTVLEFNDLKQHVLDAASMNRKYSNLPPPSSDAPAALRQLQAKAIRIRGEIEAMQEKLGPKPIDTFQSLQVTYRNEQLARTNEILSEVNAIDI